MLAKSILIRFECHNCHRCPGIVFRFILTPSWKLTFSKLSVSNPSAQFMASSGLGAVERFHSNKSIEMCAKLPTIPLATYTPCHCSTSLGDKLTFTHGQEPPKIGSVKGGGGGGGGGVDCQPHHLAGPEPEMTEMGWAMIRTARRPKPTYEVLSMCHKTEDGSVAGRHCRGGNMFSMQPPHELF